MDGVKNSHDVTQWREQFPAFRKNNNWHYLNSATTTLKPDCVIQAMTAVYQQPLQTSQNFLAESAEALYKSSRETTADFIGANTPEDIIFSSSTTHAIDQVAEYWLADRLREGDEVWISRAEHLANSLPWKRLCQAKGAHLKWIELDKNGLWDEANLADCLGSRTRLIAVTHVSSVLGCIYPIEKLCRLARKARIPVLVDGAQAVAHQLVNVTGLGCDFYVFSAHKMYGPDGVGVLYMHPDRRRECDEDTPSKCALSRFERGSLNIPGLAGMQAAMKYLADWDVEERYLHNRTLLDLALATLSEFPEVQVLGCPQAGSQVGILAFTVPGVNPQTLTEKAAEAGVEWRFGDMCCPQLMTTLDAEDVIRVSFGLYTTRDDIVEIKGVLSEALAQQA